MRLKNHYFLLRHGETISSEKGIAACWPEKIDNPLTKKGRKQIEKAAEELKSKKIDLIFTSDILRAKQTSEIVSKNLGIKPKFDKRLREINVGIFNGKLIKEIGRFWDKEKMLNPLRYYFRRYKITPPKGENYSDVEKRLKDFIKEVESKYQGENILIIGHKRLFTLLEKIIHNHSLKKFVKNIMQNKEIKTGEIRKL